MLNTTAIAARCTPRGMCMAMVAAPVSPPSTAPIAHTACNELMIERPYSRCTRSPWAFCATSTIESHAPARNNAPANRIGVGARPAANTNTASATVRVTPTRELRNRRMSAPAVSPAISAPAENAATAAP